MGSLWSFSFHDPDNGWHEVMWVKPGVPLDANAMGPGRWTMIDLD
jgi:hypothetical protein